MKNWTNIISGGYHRIYLCWFKGFKLQWGNTYPPDVIIDDLRNKGIIVWINSKVELDEDDAMDAVEVYLIVPLGAVWTGIYDYVMSFPEKEDDRAQSKVMHLMYNVPSDYSDGTLYLRYKDKKIERFKVGN